MINEIKQYKDLVEVEITDFNGKIEILYWEWSVFDFSKKYQTLKAITFPIHWWRVIDMNRIQWFIEAKNDEKTLLHKISSLTESQQENVKFQVKQYKSNFKKYPTNLRIDNVIESLINPDKEEIEWDRKIRDWKIIQDKKLKRLKFYNNLSMEERESIENTIFKKLENNWYSYILFKSLFMIEKNKIIDKMMWNSK